jgi:hypothetical protein
LAEKKRENGVKWLAALEEFTLSTFGFGYANLTGIGRPISSEASQLESRLKYSTQGPNRADLDKVTYMLGRMCLEV